MSNVTLTIGGRPHTVACAEGEEEHVLQLGRAIDARLQGMSNLAGQTETRTLLFAALLLADELHERNGIASRPIDPLPVVAENLEALASQLESMAERLEGAG